jgi:hypothetical protein
MTIGPDGEPLTEREEWQLQHGRPVPARMTWAMDIRGLEGPKVDEQVGTYEGNPDGDVDDWEAARALPRPEQVLLLARLTRFPVAWFYKPVQPGPVLGGPAWICWGGRRGCEIVPDDYVDERGVVLRAGEEPPEREDIQLGLFRVSDVAGDGGKRAPQRRGSAPAASSPPARSAVPSMTPRRAPRAAAPALLPPTRMSAEDRAHVAAAVAKAREKRIRGG